MSVYRAMEALSELHGREPQINDDIVCWLPGRASRALNRLGIETLAELTLRVPRRQVWWTHIDGIGPASAREIEALFSRRPALTESARGMVEHYQPNRRVDWPRRWSRAAGTDRGVSIALRRQGAC
jgi:hypothetical protein